MKVLVTGGTGFIGRHLLPALAERHEVLALTRRPVAEDGPDGVEWVRQDLSEPLDEGQLPERLDAIVHLAQSAHYKAFPERADDIFAVNVGGTFNLLDYARRAGASRFVFASTGGVYGGGDERLEESDPVSPINFYLRSKYAGELLLQSYESELTPVMLRLFFVYGRGQDRMLLPLLAGRVRRGEPLTVQGDPGLRINPLHVRDAVEAFVRAVEHDRPGVFNVAGPETVTLSDLVRLMGEVDGRAVEVLHAEAPPAGDLVGDIQRLESELGVVPRVGLREGLADLFAGPL